jgi:hypothetical protein
MWCCLAIKSEVTHDCHIRLTELVVCQARRRITPSILRRFITSSCNQWLFSVVTYCSYRNFLSYCVLRRYPTYSPDYTAPRPRRLKFNTINWSKIYNFFSFWIVSAIFIMIPNVYIHIQNRVRISKNLSFAFCKFRVTHIIQFCFNPFCSQYLANLK